MENIIPLASPAEMYTTTIVQHSAAVGLNSTSWRGALSKLQFEAEMGLTM